MATGFMVAEDFSAYNATLSLQLSDLWRERERWGRMAIMNIAGMGWFSSDRTIAGYARDIWDVPVAGGTGWRRLVREMLRPRGGVFEDHRGAFLADHDRRRVGVAAGHLRHDRGVGDAQALDPVDPEPRIDDGVDLAAHAAGADRMQVGDAAHADFLDHLLVALDAGPGMTSSTTNGFSAGCAAILRDSRVP